jgi:AcrR family transcriptional regulator
MDFDEAAVLRAALVAFRDEGFHACQTVSLAAATGFSWDAIIERYGDKEGLFYAVLEQARQDGAQQAIEELTAMQRKIDRMSSIPRMRLVHKRARGGLAGLTQPSSPS